MPLDNAANSTANNRATPAPPSNVRRPQAQRPAAVSTTTATAGANSAQPHGKLATLLRGDGGNAEASTSASTSAASNTQALPSGLLGTALANDLAAGQSRSSSAPPTQEAVDAQQSITAQDDPRASAEYAAYFYNNSRLDPRLPPPIYAPGQSWQVWSTPGSASATGASATTGANDSPFQQQQQQQSPVVGAIGSASPVVGRMASPVVGRMASPVVGRGASPIVTVATGSASPVVGAGALAFGGPGGKSPQRGGGDNATGLLGKDLWSGEGLSAPKLSRFSANDASVTAIATSSTSPFLGGDRSPGMAARTLSTPTGAATPQHVSPPPSSRFAPLPLRAGGNLVVDMIQSDFPRTPSPVFALQQLKAAQSTSATSTGSSSGVAGAMQQQQQANAADALHDLMDLKLTSRTPPPAFLSGIVPAPRASSTPPVLSNRLQQQLAQSSNAYSVPSPLVNELNTPTTVASPDAEEAAAAAFQEEALISSMRQVGLDDHRIHEALSQTASTANGPLSARLAGSQSPQVSSGSPYMRAQQMSASPMLPPQSLGGGAYEGFAGGAYGGAFASPTLGGSGALPYSQSPTFMNASLGGAGSAGGWGAMGSPAMSPSTQYPGQFQQQQQQPSFGRYSSMSSADAYQRNSMPSQLHQQSRPMSAGMGISQGAYGAQAGYYDPAAAYHQQQQMHHSPQSHRAYRHSAGMQSPNAGYYMGDPNAYPSAAAHQRYPPGVIPMKRADAALREAANQAIRSPLLEEFRNNKTRRFELPDVTGHAVEFSGDQHGSRFIQQKLETAGAEEKQDLFEEILPLALQLMTDVFGNYVIQKFFEHGTMEQRTTLAKQMEGNVLALSMQMYGCRVVQKALEYVPVEQQSAIIGELQGHILKCVKDQNGNHVIQKAIERVPADHVRFVLDAFRGEIYGLATHPYGCRVMQRVFEHCDPSLTQPLLDELHSYTQTLVCDQYGNYVIQHILEKGRDQDKRVVIDSVRGKLLQLSRHKFASNVVEKCVAFADVDVRSVFVNEVLTPGPDGTLPLMHMVKDAFANYVIQKILEMATPADRTRIIIELQPHFVTLRKFTYGKHILAKIEKLTGLRVGPSGEVVEMF